MNNLNVKKKFITSNKKAKSSNRVISEQYQLPTLKSTIHKQNKYLNSPYLKIINQARKKNLSLVQTRIKNQKPYSGNPLKFDIKKELNHGLNKINNHQIERDVLTANPFIPGHNSQKKTVHKKNNKKFIMAMNGLYINNMLYPPNNHNINDLLKNIKNTNYTQNMRIKSKSIYNNYKDIKHSFLNSDNKSNNIYKHSKLKY